MGAEDDSAYELSNLCVGNGGELSATARVNGRIFEISFLPQDLREPRDAAEPTKWELEFLKLVQQLDDLFAAVPSDQCSIDIKYGDGDIESAEEMGDSGSGDIASDSDCHGLEDPIETFVKRPFVEHQVFEKFAPTATTPFLSNLSDRIHPPILPFTLQAVRGSLLPVQRLAVEAGKHWAPPRASVLDSEYWESCKMVTPDQVSMWDSDRNKPQNPDLVSFEGQLCFFKPAISGATDRILVREIDMLMKMEKLGLHRHKDMRIPTLKALVVVEEDSILALTYGILLSYIPNQGSVSQRMESNQNRQPELSLRRRWFNDIKQMLQLLHDADLVWGDIKPDNMLLDSDDNVWMIDFGGGWTEDWTAREKQGTKEGDLDGLNLFYEFLRLDILGC